MDLLAFSGCLDLLCSLAIFFPGDCITQGFDEHTSIDKEITEVTAKAVSLYPSAWMRFLIRHGKGGEDGHRSNVENHWNDSGAFSFFGRIVDLRRVLYERF